MERQIKFIHIHIYTYAYFYAYTYSYPYIYIPNSSKPLKHHQCWTIIEIPLWYPPVAQSQGDLVASQVLVEKSGVRWGTGSVQAPGCHTPPWPTCMVPKGSPNLTFVFVACRQPPPVLSLFPSKVSTMGCRHSRLHAVVGSRPALFSYDMFPLELWATAYYPIISTVYPMTHQAWFLCL